MRCLSFLFLIAFLIPTRVLALSHGAPNLFVYLGAADQDATRLQMTLKEIAAVDSEGNSYALTLQLFQIDGTGASDQRLLAFGSLPSGPYQSLDVVASRARLGDEPGSELVVPLEPTSSPVAFRIDKGRTTVLQLGIGLRDTVEDGFRFTPVFRASPPRRPAAGLLGVVSTPDSNTVFLFDKVAGQIIGAVPLRGKPAGMALDPRRPRVYVAIPDEESVAVVGLLDESVQQSLRLQGGDEPRELAVTPFGETLFTANAGSSTVSVIDLFSMAEVDRISVGQEPRSPLVDPTRERLFVFNKISSSISVIGMTQSQLEATIPTEPGPFRGQLNQDGDRLFVIHQRSPYLSIIDTNTLTVVDKVLIGPGATALKTDVQRDRLYLSRRGTGLLEVWDPLSLLPVESIPTGSDVSFMAIDTDQDDLFVLLQAPQEMRSFEITGARPLFRIDLSSTPFWVVINASD